MNGSLTIGQWNCQGFSHKKPDLTNLMDNLDLLLINEAIINVNNISKAKINNCIIYYDENSANELDMINLVIILRNTLKFEIIDNIPNYPKILESIGIEIFTDKGPITIINTYKSPSGFINDSILHNYFDFLNKYDNLVIMGNFNFHHYAWGSEK